MGSRRGGGGSGGYRVGGGGYGVVRVYGVEEWGDGKDG